MDTRKGREDFPHKQGRQQSLEGLKTNPQSLEGLKTNPQSLEGLKTEERKTGSQGEISSGKEEPRRQFGRYRIEKKLGEGGMGVVYKAYDPVLERCVALKMILANRQESKDSIERFLIEAKSTAKLKHPNIVNVYDMGSENDVYFFTMDFIEGTTLEELIKQKKIDRQTALKLFVKVCHALGYAHKNDIIHRDIKPGNIMVDIGGEPKVMDFGLAKVVQSDKKVSQSGALIGTPVYMSPEQAQGKKVTPLTDVYSLGAVLYRLIAGQEPFHAPSVMKIIMKVIHEDPVPPSRIKYNVAKDLEVICLKAMSKETERRYAGADDLADDIERFLAQEPILARPASFWYRSYRKILKYKLVTGILAACLVVVVGLLLFFQRQFRMANQQEMGKKASALKSYMDKASRIESEIGSALTKPGSLDDRGLEKCYRIIREYAGAASLPVSSDEKESSLAGNRLLARQRMEKMLDYLLQDAQFFYERRLCQKSLRRFQNLKNSLYTLGIRTASLDHQKIDQALSEIYAALLKAQQLGNQAKSIFYNIHSTRKDLEQSVSLLTDSLAQNQEETETFYLRGRLHYQLLDYPRASQDFRQCLHLQEDYFPARYYLVKITPEESQDRQELEAYIRRFSDCASSQKYPAEQVAYFYLIQAYFYRFGKDYGKARDMCVQAQKTSPLLAESFYLEANFLTYCLSEDEKIEINQDRLHQNRSIYYNFGKARKSLERGLELEPGNPIAYLLRGKMSFDLFAFEKAIEDFDYVISKRPGPYLYWLRALAFLASDKREKALENFRKVKETEKGNHWMDAMMVVLSELTGKPEEARTFLEEWKAVNPPSSIQKELERLFSGKNVNASKSLAFFLSFPIAILGIRSGNVQREELSVCYRKFGRPEKIPGLDAVSRIFANQENLIEFFLSNDMFAWENGGVDMALSQFLFQKEIQADLENISTDSTYGYVSRLLAQYFRKDRETCGVIHEILRKEAGLEAAPDISCAILSKLCVIRQQRLLSGQKSFDASEPYYQQAMLSFQKKEYREAEESLRMALFMDDKSPKTHYALAKVLARRQAVEKSSPGDVLPRLLYHLQHSLSRGRLPVDSPLRDQSFRHLVSRIEPLIGKYREISKAWEKLWELRREKRYGEIEKKVASLPEARVILTDFVERAFLEEQEEYRRWAMEIENIGDRQAIDAWENRLIQAEGQFGKGCLGNLKNALKKKKVSRQERIRVSHDGKGDMDNLQEALWLASPGTVIQIFPGVYEGPLVMKSEVSLEGTKNEGEQGECVLTCPGVDVITAVNVQRCSVSNLRIAGKITVHDGEIEWRNNHIESKKGTVIIMTVTGNSRITFDKNRLSGAIAVYDQSEITIQNSFQSQASSRNSNVMLWDRAKGLFQQNEIQGEKTNVDGITLNDRTLAKIVKNKISRHGTCGIHLKDEAEAEISENRIFSNKTGIQIGDRARARVSQNEIYENKMYGIHGLNRENVESSQNILRQNDRADFQWGASESK